MIVTFLIHPSLLMLLFTDIIMKSDLKILLSGIQNHAHADVILPVYSVYEQNCVFFSYVKLEMTTLLPKHVLSALFPELISPRVFWKVEETMLHNLVLCGEWEVWWGCSSLKCSLRLSLVYDGRFSPYQFEFNKQSTLLMTFLFYYAVWMLILYVCVTCPECSTAGGRRKR